MRQVVLDTETTGLEHTEGHRIIEIGCYELHYRRATGRTFHYYLDPEREVEPGAAEVHGITSEYLVGKPRFAAVAAELLEFIRGAELIIHNAPFDVGFLDSELRRLGETWGTTATHCTVVDSLVLARELHPGQRNSLDALCRRYEVDNGERSLHGALLDARILADVYLAMTGGQAALSLETADGDHAATGEGGIERLPQERPGLAIVRADADELARHEAYIVRLEQASGRGCLWRRLDSGFTGSELS